MGFQPIGSVFILGAIFVITWCGVVGDPMALGLRIKRSLLRTLARHGHLTCVVLFVLCREGLLNSISQSPFPLGEGQIMMIDGGNDLIHGEAGK